MIKQLILIGLCAFFALSLNALEIVNAKGIHTEFDNAVLHKHPTQELKTHREKDGVIRLNNWLGFRFDIWLKEQNLGEFGTIRFESADRYLASFSREEFFNMESWLVTAQDEVPFENNALRFIVPSMREMYWIRDLNRIVLENFNPLPCPTRFYLMKPYLNKLTLQKEPKPFMNIEGWYFKDILSGLNPKDVPQVILYSRDGLKQSLEYPMHLEGAVLENTKENTYNLKSPQIPGGMWIKDIIYLQCDNEALIDQAKISDLINLAKLFDWDSNPDLSFRIVSAKGEEVLGFSDALSEPQVFEGAIYFELF
ncbi:MAG: hypothetical protein RBS43_07415 [Candidatus Cloacimonas sp.]|jgi:hypothetical protein|nr:hypothetical protein [Candidatus Cloacimonas sp.]